MTYDGISLIGLKIQHTWSWKSWHKVVPKVTTTVYEVVDYIPDGPRGPQVILRDERGNTRWVPVSALGTRASHWNVGLRESFEIVSDAGSAAPVVGLAVFSVVLTGLLAWWLQ
jgi:hypothetical protein